MKIAIVTNSVPFIAGGAGNFVEALRVKLVEYGHSAITISIPIQWYPFSKIVENVVACRSLRLPNTDLMIGLKFPTYYLPHPNKVLWLLHQFRQAYDLWGTAYQDLPRSEEGVRVREAVINADNRYLREAHRIYVNSEVTSKRLWKFNAIVSDVLYPPLVRSEHLRHREYGDYVFYPGRMTGRKRQSLLVEAAQYMKTQVRIVIAGQPETRADLDALHRTIARHGLEDRVTLIPEFISEDEKAELFAGALSCIYTPYDEDSYGYVTLEACYCRKPIITCTDSGATSLLVLDQVTGRRVSPDAKALAAAIDELGSNRKLAQRWGEAAFERMTSLGIGWDNVIRKLTS